MKTIVDLIRRLENLPERHLGVYDRRGRALRRLPYPELALRSARFATALREQGCRAGQQVFLQLSDPEEIVTGFLGAMVAGAVPGCLAPPRALGGLDVFRERMQRLLEAFPGAALVAHDSVGEASGQAHLAPPSADCALPPTPLPSADPDALAFVQLTSGSTRLPRAVRIRHRALIANVQGIVAGGRGRPEDVFVSWLPLYHDMGLVGMLFCALGNGSTLHMLRPETFVARPRTWLQALGACGGPGVSTAPNFAYQHCVDAIGEADLEGLDLSQWKVAGCGAERVRADTLRDFAERFSRVGFRATSFVPCYGMAEATLAVTFSLRDAPPLVHEGHVCCGPPMPDTEIVVRDPDGVALPEGAQGEITVRGPGLCDGYAGAGAEDPFRDGWLHTGDRGYLRGGELYVTGRLGDLVILDGVNVDPQEVEWIGESVVRTLGGRCAAFSVEAGRREALVLVAEVDPASREHWDAWGREIATRVAAVYGSSLHDLRFVRRGTLPKTSSGKVQRSQLKLRYESGDLPSLWRRAAPDAPGDPRTGRNHDGDRGADARPARPDLQRPA